MISFVYFDIGGVTIQDFSKSNKWTEMERDQGITPDKHAKFIKLWHRHTKRINLDQDIDDLVSLFQRELNLQLPDNYSWLDDFIGRFKPNYSLWPVIQKIKESISVGLLTNMYPRMFNQIKQAGLLPSVDWDIIVDSSIEMLQKPEPEIYHLAETKSGANPQEILFIDNQPENLIVPQTLGWQTFLYDSADYETSTLELQTHLGGVFKER